MIRLDRPRFNAVQTQFRVGPEAEFAKFAVIDDVDADVGLPPHNLRDRAAQARFDLGIIAELACEFATIKFFEIRWPVQRARMRRKNPISAELHALNRTLIDPILPLVADFVAGRVDWTYQP